MKWIKLTNATAADPADIKKAIRAFLKTNKETARLDSKIILSKDFADNPAMLKAAFDQALTAASPFSVLASDIDDKEAGSAPMTTINIDAGVTKDKKEEESKPSKKDGVDPIFSSGPQVTRPDFRTTQSKDDKPDNRGFRGSRGPAKPPVGAIARAPLSVRVKAGSAGDFQTEVEDEFEQD